MTKFISSDRDKDLMKTVCCTGNSPETNLRYLLEEQYGFWLCVHTRNFLPGVPSARHFANATRVSRRTIILLTRYNHLCKDTNNFVKCDPNSI